MNVFWGLVTRASAGMGIPIGKLSRSTPPVAHRPGYTLPVVLDVGTNNHSCNNPLYMGWRNPRITDDEYYEFVDELSRL
ncbi:hypothetical protein ACLK1S_09285 [Escherichia coli]